MWVRSLDQEDPLEEGMATHSSILAWRVPWTEKPVGGATFHRGCRELDTTEQLKLLGILWLLRNNFTELPVSDKANLKPQWSRKNKTNQDRSIVKSECEQKHILQTTKCPNMPLFLVNMNDCCFFTDYSFSLTSCLSRRLHENAQWYGYLCLLIASSSKPSPTFSSPSSNHLNASP